MTGTLTTRLLFSTLLLAIPAILFAREEKEKVPEAKAPAKVAPGSTAWLKTELGMTYFLRVPGSYNKKAGVRMVVFMHGSNMNGLDYLRTFEAKGWCEHDLLVCPNGEKGKGPFGANNFTFYSAKFIAGLVKEVSKAFKVRRTYLGGHSQGGFVTYSAIMLHPELFDGAFPMAGDCWMQNEPNLWEEEPEKMAMQKKIAIAVIHGRRDPVVDFSQGEHAHDVFDVMAYPMLKLFAPENLGHQFGLSPVPEALAWLDAMKGVNPKHAERCAEEWAMKGQWADAVPAARHVLELKAPSALKSRARALLRKAEKAAKGPAKAMVTAMNKEKALTWLPKWFEFRRRFGLTKAAAPLVSKYDNLRTKHRSLGDRLFGEAQGFFRSGNKNKAYEKYEELLEKAPCSYHAYYAMNSLARRK